VESLKEIENILMKYNSYLLTTHVNADGDAIGSILGLGRSLENLGKKVFYLVPGVPSHKFSFLKGFESINKELENAKEAEVLVILDAPNLDRVEGFNFKIENYKTIVRIDHHASEENHSHVKFVKVGYPSTTCLVFEIINDGKFPMDEDIANALYTGLLTDTGSFRFNNTSEIAFGVAKELVKFGANPYFISRMVYEMETLTHLKLLGIALLRMEIIENLGFSYITQEDFKNYNATENDTEGIVDYLRKEKDIEIVLFLRELKEGGFKGSIRSKNHIDVRKIAEFFGGGGHREASGFTSKLSKEDILKIVLDKIKNEEKSSF